MLTGLFEPQRQRRPTAGTLVPHNVAKKERFCKKLNCKHNCRLQTMDDRLRTEQNEASRAGAGRMTDLSGKSNSLQQ